MCVASNNMFLRDNFIYTEVVFVVGLFVFCFKKRSKQSREKKTVGIALGFLKELRLKD